MRRQIFTATLIGLGVTLGAAGAWADGTETLGPPSIAIASGTGIIGAGTGLVDGPGTIDIDVPGTVQQALLYWGCFASAGGQDNDIMVDGNLVTGDPVAGIGGPTLLVDGIESAGYRADITGLGLVSEGVNSLSLDGLDCNFRSNGAGVMVIYDDGVSLPAVIEIRDGDDFAFQSLAPTLDTTVPQTIVFPPSTSERTADLVLFFHSVADNQPRPSSVDITVGGQPTIEKTSA